MLRRACLPPALLLLACAIAHIGCSSPDAGVAAGDPLPPAPAAGEADAQPSEADGATALADAGALDATDGAADGAVVPRCDLAAQFTSVTPAPMPPVAITMATLTADELLLVAEKGGGGVLTLERAKASDPFLSSGSGTGFVTVEPALSPDGLRFYYEHLSTAPGHYMTSRPSRSAAWGTATKMEGFPPGYFHKFAESADGGRLYYLDNTRNQVVQAPRVAAGIDPTKAVTVFTRTGGNLSHAISADEKTMYVVNGYNTIDGVKFGVFRLSRASLNVPFTTSVLVPELINAANDYADNPVMLTPDNCRLYVLRGVATDKKLYVASREPTP